MLMLVFISTVIAIVTMQIFVLLILTPNHMLNVFADYPVSELLNHFDKIFDAVYKDFPEHTLPIYGRAMRILLVTDTWEPNVNGVVTTIRYLIRQLEELGHQVKLIHPGQFPTLPLFCHKDLRMVTRPWRIIPIIQEFEADAVHIFTEGPLGVTVRMLCTLKRLPFTTSYHTRFPEFIEIYLGIPNGWIYPLINW
jgi:hypothetical protein